MACAALFHPAGVDTRPQLNPDSSAEDTSTSAEQHLHSRPEQFWNEVLEASREHWLQYRNCGKVRVAVALWWVARCVERGPKGTARGAQGSDVGARMASALRHHACVLCDSVLHIPTKSRNIMGEVDDEGEMIDLSGESLARKDAWRISLFICAESHARMNHTRLGNLSDGLSQRIREVSTSEARDAVHRQLCVLGVEVCAFTCIAARVLLENRAAKDIEAAENELVRVLGLAVDRQVIVPSQDALCMLANLQNVPNGVVRYGEDFAPVVSWLLVQIRRGMHTLHEGEIASLLKNLVGAHVRLTDHPEFAEDLREAVGRATYRPRSNYASSVFLSMDDSAGSPSEPLEEWEVAEREERLWLQAHSRNAAGFNPTEAAEAALAAKSLQLFDGGSTQLEALLAVSMSGTMHATGTRSNGAAESGQRRRPRHRGCVDSTLVATFESFTARLMPATASWLSDSSISSSAGESNGNGNGSSLQHSVADIDITRENLPVYSALAAVEAVQLGAAALSESWDGEVDSEDSGSFDGEAAETVSLVMEESGCGVLECVQALGEHTWNAQAAIDQLLQELVAEQALQATADEC